MYRFSLYMHARKLSELIIHNTNESVTPIPLRGEQLGITNVRQKCWRDYVTVEGRRTYRVMLSPFLKGGNSIFIAAVASGRAVTRITTARMAQIERKWDLITKT